MKRGMIKFALFVAVAWPASLACGADDPKPAATTAPAATTKSDADGAKTETKKVLKGRLPRNYTKLVSDAQKQQIYQVESDFAPKIKAAREQLAALLAQENKEIRTSSLPINRKNSTS